MLTQEGGNALIKCVDPFHDTEVPVGGIPDNLPEPSVCRQINKSMVLSKPASLLDAPYDIHIYTLPERNTWYASTNIANPAANTRGNLGVLSAAGVGTIASNLITNDYPIAGIVIVYTSTGLPTTAAAVGYSGANVVYQVLGFDEYYSGQNREISSGLEVHNVTAEIYKSGTCTVYRCPQSNVDSCTILKDTNPATPVNYQCLNASVSRIPPGSLEQALLLPGSRQWDAGYGAYVVETYRMEDNHPITSQLGTRAFSTSDFVGGHANITDSLPTVFGNSWNLGALNWCHPCSFKAVPKDTSGIYLTGLDPKSQFTLTVRKIIETFPTFADPLVTLARSTPDYDPIFFKLYKEIAQNLPPGVMVGENASGDFWDRILGIVSDIGPMLSAFGPVGGAIGTVGSAIAKSVQAKRNEPPKAKADPISGYNNTKKMDSKAITRQKAK